ncbi:MAG: homoserine kinase [Alphaproteobacteria bacterium]
MAVYTEVGDEELAAFVADYDIGEVVALKGIAEGVENSNYLLQTDQGLHFLTLYEKRVRPEDLPFFIALMRHLATHDIPCPLPVPARDGEVLRQLAGRPAAIVTFLRGVSPKRPNVAQCGALGEALADLHRAGQDFEMTRPNDLSVAGWRRLLDGCGTRADEVAPGLLTALEEEFSHLQSLWPDHLPDGVIHADLFADNVLFLGEEVSGLIDFYFACNDLLAYDLAVCLNAWCFEPGGEFNITKARRMLAGYGSHRALSAAEVAALPLLARGAALRFLLTRLYDWLNQVDGALVKPKDPLEYLAKLRFHQRVRGVGEYGLDG